MDIPIVNRLGRALIAALSLALFALPASAAPAAMTVYVTVDWEGLSLEPENLEAMRAFRQRYPHIPMLHLLNPAYYLRAGADNAAINAKIKSTLLPGDTLGLHVHPWKSLIVHCELPYRSAPTFATLDEDCFEGECGYTVSLEQAYSATELTRLIGCSAELLQAQGFGKPTVFRAGGWQFGPKLAEALQANGFTLDSSRTDARLVASRWGPDSRLVRLLRQLHPDGSHLDQPYLLGPGLMEYPNNGSLADYTSPQKLAQIMRELLDHGKTVLVLGFHQETAFDYLHRLEAAIPLLEQEAARAGVTLRWAALGR